MNPVAQKYGAAQFVAVNLLPKEIAERKKMRAVQTVSVIAVLVAIGVVAAGFLLFFAATQLVKSQYDDARADEEAAVAARDAKASVYADVAERERQEYTLTQIGFGEMDYAQITSAIQQTANDQSSFDSIQVDGPAAFGLGGGAQDPLFRGGVGTFTFSARAVSLESATQLIARIEAVPGLAHVRAQTEAYAADGADIYYSIAGVGVITDLRLTGRLTPLDGISGVDGLTVIQSMSPETLPSASPEPSASPSATTDEEG